MGSTRLRCGSTATPSSSGRDGKPVGDIGAILRSGRNWVTVDDLNPYELWNGHAPTNDNEIGRRQGKRR